MVLKREWNLNRVKLCLALCAAVSQGARAGAQTVPVVLAGPPVTVFSHARDACEAWDIPDAPARAIRLGDGTVRLYAAHWRNRRLTGPDLLDVRNDCRVVLQGREDSNPAAYDDRLWIAALHLGPDGRVHAVVHDEYQGHRRSEGCGSGRYMDCWYNTLRAAVSDGGDDSFRLNGLIATLPYRYDEGPAGHRGYFNPTGLVRHGPHWFMMAFATASHAQRAGNCLLRTGDPADPAAWRAWDGSGFGRRFVNPYAAAVTEPQAHVCVPLPADGLPWPVTSLTAVRGGFLALMMKSGGAEPGVYAAFSEDLTGWRRPVRVLAAVGPDAPCGDGLPRLAYPSLLDPLSADPDFGTAGATAWLFATRFEACVPDESRDLIRYPVRVTGPG